MLLSDSLSSGGVSWAGLALWTFGSGFAATSGGDIPRVLRGADIRRQRRDGCALCRGASGAGPFGCQAAKAGRRAGSAGLAPHLGFLIGIVRTEPDITLKEPAAALSGTEGVQVHLSSLHRALDRAGLSYERRADRRRTGSARVMSGASGLDHAAPAEDTPRATQIGVHRRDSGQNEPHPPSRACGDRRAASWHGFLGQMGDTDVHRRTDAKRADRPLGHLPAR